MNIREASSDPALVSWLRRVNPDYPKHNRTSKVYQMVLLRFCRFARLTPSELLEKRKQDANAVLDLLQSHIVKLKGTVNYLKLCYAIIRSFFSHNRLSLPVDPTFKIKKAKPPITVKLTPEILRMVLSYPMPLKMKSLFFMMVVSGMDLSEIDFVNRECWPQIRQQLNDGVDVLKIDIAGRKQTKNVGFYKLVGGKAVEVLKQYVAENKIPMRGPLWSKSNGEPCSKQSIQRYWRKLLVESGVIKKSDKGRLGFKLHSIRNIFKSKWHKSGVDYAIAEFLMGHVSRLKRSDPDFYDRIYTYEIDWVKDQYRKALPFIEEALP